MVAMHRCGMCGLSMRSMSVVSCYGSSPRSYGYGLPHGLCHVVYVLSPVGLCPVAMVYGFIWSLGGYLWRIGFHP